MKASLRRLLAAAPFAIVAAGPAFADPAIWKVSDADSAVYLFGSMHAFTRPVDWRSAAFDELLATADHVYFEVIMDVEAYSAITLATITKGRIAGGKSLADLLTPDQYNRLETAAATIGVDLNLISRMQPWLANMTLAASALSATSAGVETLVETEVAADRKRGLETAAEQMGFLADPPLEDQITELMSSVDGINSGASLDLEPMIAAWETGDVATLDSAMSDFMTPADKPFYERLITRRNQTWLDPIEQLLADNDQSLIIVGAGHLVGAGGVPALLEDAGYTVVRVDQPEAGAALHIDRTRR